jgi:hypothetical protein
MALQYFPTRKPTPEEYHDCPDTHLHELTYEEHPDWNPHSLSLNRQEENMMETFGRLNEPHTRSYNHNIAAISAPLRTLETVNNENSYTRAKQHSEYHSQCSAVLSNVTTTLNDDQFATAMTNDVKVRYSSIHSTTTGSKQSKLTAPELACKWNIGLEAAEQTLKVTTQRGIRNVTRQNLTKRYPTSDRHFYYRRLNTTLFTDTLIANSPSIRGNKYAQVYCNDLEWSRLYPMKKKSEAHETLSLLLKRDGAPTTLVSDGANEETLGEFRRKARKAETHCCKETEPHSPWQNRAEGCTGEIKRATGRAMLKTKSPSRLWDYCAELKARIRSHTTHNLPSLEDEVPETLMTGSTVDISQLVEFGWYDWVFF